MDWRNPEGFGAWLARGHKGIFGGSGSGKSTAEKYCFNNVPHPWVGVFITPHDDLPSGQRARTPMEVLPLIRRGAKRIVWRAPKEHEVEGGRDGAVERLQILVTSLIEHGKRLMVGDKAPVWCICIIDEVHNFTSKTGYIGPVEALYSEGRKYGIRVIVASQRPARVSLEILGQSKDVLLYRLEPPDAQYLQRQGYPLAEFERWTDKPYHFVIMQGKDWSPYVPLPEA